MLFLFVAQVSHFGGGFSDPHSEGNFGPFQICYGYIITHCAGGRPGGFQTWRKTLKICLCVLMADLVFLQIKLWK